MDSRHPDRAAAFDALFTTNHIQMLKLLISYLDPAMQGRLAVYIKFLELEYTLRFFQNHPAAMPLCPRPVRPDGGLPGLLEELLPYCSASERENLQNFQKLYQNIENMQEMMQMVEMMQEIAPEMFSGDGTPGFGGFSSSHGPPPMPDNMADLLNMLSGLGGTGAPAQ